LLSQLVLTRGVAMVLSTQGAEGITVPEILHFIGWGGIFLQVGFDDYLPVDDIPDNQGTAVGCLL